MRIPKLGDVLTNDAGQKWVVETFITGEELADGMDEDDAPEPGYFQITLVEGDDADDIDALAIELDSGDFPEFCQENGIRL